MSSNQPRDAAAHPPVEADAMQITVRPEYATRYSDPRVLQYVFTYDVTIENVGGEVAQLLWRHWLIHDPVAGDHEVEGEGVVGKCPVLRPGEAHRYQSFCVLRGPKGHMEGFYHFRRPDGSLFRAPIPRFHFHAPPEAAGTLLN